MNDTIPPPPADLEIDLPESNLDYDMYCRTCTADAVAVFFHGGPGRGGEIDREDELRDEEYDEEENKYRENLVLKIYRTFRSVIVPENNFRLEGTIVKPGTFGGINSNSVTSARDFIVSNYEGSDLDVIIIFGYSWGGHHAIKLCELLENDGYEVDGLIIVDMADGPFRGSTIDTTVTGNVKRTVNYYQTSYSGGSSSSDSPDTGSTSDSPGSRGWPITGEGPVENVLITEGPNDANEIKPASHGTIINRARYLIWDVLEEILVDSQ